MEVLTLALKKKNFIPFLSHYMGAARFTQLVVTFFIFILLQFNGNLQKYNEKIQ